MANETAEDIKKGFKALGNGIKEAGERRVKELVEKQGYVGYRNKDAAELFKKEHANWECKYIDGEYRYYPPIKNENIDFLKTYKEAKEKNASTCITIEFIDNVSVKYNLTVVDKHTGERKIIQSEKIKIDNKFLYETLPSLYNQLCSSMPVIDYEKDKGMNFTSVDGNNVIMIGGLTEENKEFIKNMKTFVDEKNGFNIYENNKGR